MGPYKVPTLDEFRYFFTVVDDCSRATWIFLLRGKDETVLYIKNFVLIIRNQFQCNVKVCQSDNGSKFANAMTKDLFSQLGILYLTICISTPQKNGIVEHKHHHLLEVAHALKLQAAVPNKHRKLLDKCYSIYYFTRKSPFYVLYKKPFDYRTFGSLVHCVMLPIFGKR